MFQKLIYYLRCCLFVFCLLIIGCNDKEGGDNIEINKQVELNAEDIKNSKIFVEKYPNGKLKVKGQFKNGLRDSLWISYYPNGLKQSENYYIDSLLHGNSVAYYQNGNVRYIGFYIEGKKHGKWIFKDMDGKEQVFWYENGQKK